MSSAGTELDKWLLLARKGDLEAWSRLVASQRPRLKRMIALRLDQRVVGRVDPSDVVQEVLIKAVAHRDQFFAVPTEPVYAWLRKIAANELIDLHRRHVKSEKRTVLREQWLGLNDASTCELAQQLASRQRSPSGCAVHREMVVRVQTALVELPVQAREVLVLKYLEQLTSAEAAAVLGVNIRTVQLRHRQALNQLAELLDRPAPGGTAEGPVPYPRS